MSPPKIELCTRVEKACRLVERAAGHAEIWLLCEERSADYRRAWAQHNFFIKMTAHAHRVTTIVESWAMLDDGDQRRRMSLPLLAAELSVGGALNTDCADRIRDRLKSMAAYPKVRRLRHEAIAHRSASLSFDDIFKDVALSPDELRALLNEMTAAANVMAEAASVRGCEHAEVGHEAKRALAVLGRLSGYNSI